MFRKVSLLVVIVLLLTSALSSSVFAQGVPEKGQPEVMSNEASVAEISATEAMWTRDAMLAAKPMAWPALNLGAEATTEAMAGAPNSALGTRPVQGSAKEAQKAFAEEWAILKSLDAQTLQELAGVGAVEAPEGTANVYTQYQENYQNDYPHRAIGKLFTSAGSCTATVISPNNIIVTAAHCVYNTVNNTWYTNRTFAPAYRNGTRPYGTFPGTSAWILTAYANASSPVTRYDVAVIRLGNNSAGRPVTYYTGSLGRSWNYGSVLSLFAFGFPGNLGSGQTLQVCAAESLSGGTDVLGMGCNMTYGSSGGPWVRVYKPYFQSSTNYVDSVVSGGDPAVPTFYGARFTSNNIVPLCNSAGC